VLYDPAVTVEEHLRAGRELLERADACMDQNGAYGIDHDAGAHLAVVAQAHYVAAMALTRWNADMPHDSFEIP
jgi:hypothetical protein